MKFKDIVNQKINSRTHQISFDFQKRKASQAGIDIKKLMETEIGGSDKLEKFMNEKEDFKWKQK